MLIWDDLKRPVNIISLSIGFLSIVVSLFLYFASLKSREPVFLVNEARGKIFDNSITSPAIKVLDKNDQLINEDIYLVTAAFWNAGELPIEPEHIRQPIKLKISPIKRLLDYTILKQVDPEISKIKLIKISESEIELTWEHLDPGYGARLQLIYSGEKDAEILIKGKIIGAKVKNVQGLGKKNELLIIYFTVFLNFLFIITIYITNFLSPKKSIKNKFIISLFLTIILISALTIIIFIFIRPFPPV